MTLRTANADDIDQLEAWDEEPHVRIGTGHDPDDEDAGWDWEDLIPLPPLVYPPWREILIAELCGQPIGLVQIIDPAEEETHNWGVCPPSLRAVDIWIGPPERLGRGHGAEMMRLTLSRCFADGKVRAVLVDPLETNTRSRRFFERLGFVSVGPRAFGDDRCHVYRLDRSAWIQSQDV